MLEIGFAVYYYRLEKGMTQVELASRAGVPQPNLSNIEKGKKDITLATLKRLSLALGVPAASLIEEGGFERAGKKIKFSRATLEKIAERIVEPTLGGLDEEAGEIVRLFRLLLPSKGRGKPGGAELQHAWIKLRKMLTAGEIQAVYRRVQDAEQRTR